MLLKAVKNEIERYKVKMLGIKYHSSQSDDENIRWPTKSYHHHTYHNEAKPAAANFVSISQTSKLIPGAFFSSQKDPRILPVP